jgi:hypothetical protein
MKIFVTSARGDIRSCARHVRQGHYLFGGCDILIHPEFPLLAIVRFGSKADISRKRHVRFTPESGHLQRNSPCLLWANSGHRALGDASTVFWRYVLNP